MKSKHFAYVLCFMALVFEKIQQPSRFSIQNEGNVPQGIVLFEVLRADRLSVFAVYEDGVWVYTDTVDSKGIKGGSGSERA